MLSDSKSAAHGSAAVPDDEPVSNKEPLITEMLYIFTNLRQIARRKELHMKQVVKKAG